MKIGIVDLDTSHPQNWIPIQRELGHEIVGVWDGGSVHPPEYVASFVKEHNLGRVYDSLEALAGDADCAIIHGCDWDTHIPKAAPFVAAGKSVLIDKPLAGNLRDLNQLRAWVRAGARISGGSSLRFCVETRDWLARPVSQRGTPHTVLCGCAVDEFNYGIHAYSMLSGILGPGIQRVRHLSSGVQRRVEVTWSGGTPRSAGRAGERNVRLSGTPRSAGFLVIGPCADWLPFYATVITEKSVTQFQADSRNLYRALLEAVLPYLAREADEPPVPIAALIEPELCALAARRSWLEGDHEVTLAELKEDDPGYDGATFADGYRAARYPK